jgi:hypothetical protein
MLIFLSGYWFYGLFNILLMIIKKIIFISLFSSNPSLNFQYQWLRILEFVGAMVKEKMVQLCQPGKQSLKPCSN